ncbi:peptidase S1 family protein [Williamsia sp. 1135]|uniref:peptidase S1 family protein n=1 Tax=Williamsia sp. 1135 TaxID=1889262 RepID=UPI000A0F5F8E|nr:peptidase S1 family protein [Williamsia sp. 1135]ORM29155.1 peptidase S1 family protein [Williamsia sp. 1135]
MIGALAVLTGSAIAPATAIPSQAKAPLGGGTGIVIEQWDGTAAICTLTTIGHDQDGNLIGLTAGHCGDPGQSVLSELWPPKHPLGVIAEVDTDLDYALIHFDERRVEPLRTVGRVTIDSVQMAPPHFPDIACKDGRTTGHTCGVVWISGHEVHISQMCVIEGDSGAPVVLGTRLVGMVNAYFEVACAGPEKGTNIGPIMRALKARGITGFTLA